MRDKLVVSAGQEIDGRGQEGGYGAAVFGWTVRVKAKGLASLALAWPLLP